MCVGVSRKVGYAVFRLAGIEEYKCSVHLTKVYENYVLS